MKACAWILVASLASASGARAAIDSLTFDWFDPASLRKGPPPGPAHAAVVRRMHEQWLLRWPAGADPVAHVGMHFAIEVRREDAVQGAQAAFPSFGKKAKVTTLKARTIAVDGSIREVAEDAILEAKSTSGEDEGELKVFRFPRVEVGSILEVIAVYEGPLFNSRDRPVLGAYPIDRYDLELLVDPKIEFDVAFFGYDKPLSLQQTDGMQHLHVRLDKVPADADEANKPSRPERGPYFMYRALRYAIAGERWPGNLTWGKALTWTTKRLMGRLQGDADAEDRVWDGFALRADVDGCGDARCRTERALALVRDVAPAKGWGATVRPMREVLDEKAANAWEQNALLWRLLVDAGVQARLAYAVRRGWGPFVADFPSDFWFDQLLVELPPQAGVPQRTFVDASCEHCRFGEIPYWVEGVDAVVVTHDDWIFSKVDVTGEVVKVSGAVRGDNETATRWVLKLAEDGAARVETTATATGSAGQEACVTYRAYRPGDWRDDAVARAARAHPGSVVVDAPPGACDRAAGTWRKTRAYDAPAAGVRADVDGRATMIVPLSFLVARWDGEHDADPAKRVNDLVLPDGDDAVDVVEIVPPPGWRVASLPPSWRRETPAFASSFAASEEGGVVKVERRADARRGRWPRAGYRAFHEAVRAYEDARRGGIVLVKDAVASTP